MENEIKIEEEKKLQEVIEQISKEEENLEQTLSASDMNYDLENIAQGQIVQMHIKRLEDIRKIKNEPYFARMDFKENSSKLEKFYIGKISVLDSKTLEPIIVDWRAPISNLYYEGKIGKATYECLGENIEGEIFLKRQYIIENQKLKKYVNINVTGNDELLQNALEEKADDRLKNIVATIQNEQNKIIRAPINSPLIVQGVAGSGKTTIALHRIAYLIYNYEKEFKPEEFMIIAPTKFFLNYISNILPDLGVDNVKQCTFEDFAYDVIGKKLKISDNNEKLVIIVNKDFNNINNVKTEIMIQESKFKSSIKFKQIVDKYLEKVENEYVPNKDFCYDTYTIMTYNEINNLFKNVYKMYNFEMRVNEIEKNLISELKKKIPKIVDNLTSERSLKIRDLSTQERIIVFDEYDKKINYLEKKYKKIVENFLKQFPRKNCLDYYYDFINNYLNYDIVSEKLQNIKYQNDKKYCENINALTDEFIQDSLIHNSHGSVVDIHELILYIQQNTLSNLKKNEVCFEDLAPLMYIQFKISGIKDKCKIKHVVIDEAQDYGEFQFDVLKTILNSNSMTILGDIAQGVHYYRGIENWKRFIDVEFNNVKTTYTTLNKTYRTTKEIMDVANSVISKLPDYEREFIVLGEPVIDRKNSISLKKCIDFSELISEINLKINDYLGNGFKSIAIIGKDMKECTDIYQKLCTLRSDVKLIQGKDSEYNAGISIVPSYLAKGLEFDCVIISNASEEKYELSSLDIKLLYVTITRAMSRLDVFYIGEISKLLM